MSEMQMDNTIKSHRDLCGKSPSGWGHPLVLVNVPPARCRQKLSCQKEPALTLGGGELESETYRGAGTSIDGPL